MVNEYYQFYMIRLGGWLCFLSGMVLMAYNMFMTIAAGKATDAPVVAPVVGHAHA